jgi:hypothetical protein
MLQDDLLKLPWIGLKNSIKTFSQLILTKLQSLEHGDASSPCMHSFVTLQGNLHEMMCQLS